MQSSPSQQYILKDQPAKEENASFVEKIMNQFEYRFPNRAGSIYMLSFIFYMGFVIVISNDYILYTQHNYFASISVPYYQQMFMSLLISMLINYYACRKLGVALSMEDSTIQQHVLLIAALYGLGFTCINRFEKTQGICIGFTCIGYQQCLFYLFGAWLVSYVVEINFFGERYQNHELMGFVTIQGLTLGYFLSAQPNILGDASTKQVAGILFSLKAATCLYLGSQRVRTLCSTSCLTLFHNVMFAFAIMLSLTFGIHEFNPFTLEIVIFIIGNGLLLNVFGQLAIRAIQIDPTARVLSLFYMIGPFVTVQCYLTDGFQLLRTLGFIISVGSCTSLMLDRKVSIQVGTFQVDLEENYRYLEMSDAK